MLIQEGWTPPPPAEDENERLRALRRYEILDTLPEEAFERITRMASAIMQMPIALISFIDHERQWFKSCHGVNIQQVPRDVALCSHTIAQKKNIDCTEHDQGSTVFRPSICCKRAAYPVLRRHALDYGRGI